MKPTMKLTALAFFMGLSSVSFAQLNPSEKFDQQSNWKMNQFTNEHNAFQFWSYVTSRGTIRVETSPANNIALAKVTVASDGTKLMPWREACSSQLRGATKSFKRITMEIEANPWAQSASYRTSKNTYNWNNVENAPAVKNVAITLKGSTPRWNAESPLVVSDYRLYLRRVQAELDSQLKAQTNDVMTFGTVQFDLSLGLSRDLACDIITNNVSVYFSFEIESEPAKGATKTWIVNKTLSDVYSDMKLQASEGDPIKGHRAGMLLGMALQKLAPNADYFQNFRDSKLFGVFYSKQSDTDYALKSMDEDELRKASGVLPELDFNSTIKKGSIERIDLGEISVSEVEQ